MKSIVSLAALLTTAASLVSASVSGTVVNRTAGKSQAGVAVSLVRPSEQGMQPLGNTTTDAAGHFSLDDQGQPVGPRLLQANYGGINYNQLITPNMPSSNIELDVYEATASPAVARIAQQMMVFEPDSSRITVDETVLVSNSTNTTYNNHRLGALRFYLPPAANGQVRVSAQGAQGMALPRPAEKTEETNVFKVDFPIKPGETQFQIAYVLPVGAPFHFQGRVVNVEGMPSGPLRLIAPAGVTLAGNDIERIGTEPKTQATIFNVIAPNFSVDVTGAGSLHSDQDANTDNSDSPPVTQALPQIYAHLGWLIGVALSVLAVGLILLFRNSPVRSPYTK